MPTPSPVRLVCFDLGGVLVRLATGWADACAHAGVDLPHADDAAWKRHHALMVRYETGEIDEAGYLREVPGCIGTVTEQTIGGIFDAWLRGMYPGAAELIDELNAGGLATACLSNTNPRHWNLLWRTPEYEPLKRLKFRMASHALRAMKPAEAIYRHAERVTGFAGSEILFFDDKPENVAAARAVGWRSEIVDRVDDAVPQLRQFLEGHGVL